MNLYDHPSLRVVIVRPGQTELDEQGRIAGNLDVPLSEDGKNQILQLVEDFGELSIGKIFTGPSTAAKQTADLLASKSKVKLKVEEDLRNLDCGLWHGKRIEELKETQPRLFKLWQEQPEAVFPPNGETIEETRSRVEKFAKKLTKRPKAETVIVVAAEPIACILRSVLEAVDLSTYWTVEANCGTWIEVHRDLETVNH